MDQPTVACRLWLSHACGTYLMSEIASLTYCSVYTYVIHPSISRAERGEEERERGAKNARRRSTPSRRLQEREPAPPAASRRR